MLLGTEQDNARFLEHRWATIGVVLFMHDPDARTRVQALGNVL